MAGTKQNITLAMEKRLLKQARALAAERGLSVSALLSGELARLVEREGEYRRAQTRAVARLESPLHLNFTNKPSRESLHDRQGLR
jgi:hypothetical protein